MPWCAIQPSRVWASEKGTGNFPLHAGSRVQRPACVAQVGRAPARQAGVRGFEPRRRRVSESSLHRALRLEVGYSLAASGLSQTHVASTLGISRKHLCRMLSGKAAMSADWAERIAAVCGYRIALQARPVEEPWVFDTS